MVHRAASRATKRLDATPVASSWMKRKAKKKKGQGQTDWSVPLLALILVPLCAGLAWFAYGQVQRQRAIAAFMLIDSKGVDVSFRPGSPRTVRFTNANVTDADLAAFVPAFSGYAPPGFERIGMIRLNASPVSDDAVARFRQAVPDCEIER